MTRNRKAGLVAAAAIAIAAIGVVFATFGERADETAIAAPLPNVSICHETGVPAGKWLLLTVNGNAVPAHLGHGDFVVGEDGGCPPEEPTETATSTVTATPTEEPTDTPERTREPTETPTDTPERTREPTETPTPTATRVR